MFKRQAEIVTLTVSGQEIRTTAEHPFYIIGKGWLIAAELQVGDQFASHDGNCGKLESIRRAGEHVDVYNFRVSNWHTYFVGSDEWGFSVWAHNADYEIHVTPEGKFRLRNKETGEWVKPESESVNPNAAPREFTQAELDVWKAANPDVKVVAPAAYKFEAQGISYSSEVVKNADGSTAIVHYATKDGTRHTIGISEITKEGQLTNAFQVPKELQQLDLSKRMYAEAERAGFKSTAGQYHPSSDNFKEFYKVYDPAKANEVEALFRTPAGKVAKQSGMKPTQIKVGPDKVEVVWVKE